MGFLKNSSSAKDTEAKRANDGTIKTEIEEKNKVERCCEKCRTNKLFMLVQGLLSAVLLVLVIILFVMVLNINSRLDASSSDNLSRTVRTKNVPPSTGYSTGLKNENENINEESVIKKDAQKVNITTRVPLTKKPKPLLETLQIIGDPVLPHPEIKLNPFTYSNGTNCTCIGQRGARGPRGRRGRPAKEGRRGRPGKRGPQGPPGSKGERGVRGLTGKAGPPGDVGAIGLPGLAGPKGEKGDSGRRPINSHPVCHATGYQVLAVLHEMPKGILRNWETKDGFSTLTGGMKFSQGIMTIPEYGFYNVYSQVFFQADTPGLDVHLVHYVYLFRKMRRSKRELKYILLRGFATRPTHTVGQQAFFTTHAFGAFRLMPGDRLAIGVDPTHLPLISYAESATYFGAYMI